MSSKLNIVLYQPEIPGNTGSIGRTTVALDCRLILIKPYGFSLEEKEVKRAGLDYWQHVDLTEYSSWGEFYSQENPPQDNIFLFSKNASQIYYDADFKPESYLIFGRETSGLPQELHENYRDNFYSLPQYSNKIRSLNLANTATAVAYEALRKISYT